MTTIAEIVDGALEGQSVAVRQALIGALTEREDGIADALRQIGDRYSMYPQIVAEAICHVGLGTAPDEETRAFIHAQYQALMQQLIDQHNQQHGEGNTGI